jgi:hypothetical protein
MAEIRLTEGTIRFQDEWLSADDIKARIKEKMDTGDMKFAEEAAALEELNQAMEKAQPIEIRLVLSKGDYEKLRKRGGDDDNESVRKAILALIEGGGKKTPVMEKPKSAPAPKPPTPESPEPEPPEPGPPARTVTCSKCNRVMEVPAGEDPSELECDFCGMSIPVEKGNEAAPPEPKPKPEPKPEAKAEENTAGLSESGIRHKDHFIG